MVSDDPQCHDILTRLSDEGVEAIVVGMVAAVLQGVPMMPWDLDIVHRRTPENIDRVLRVLEDSAPDRTLGSGSRRNEA